MQSSPLNNLSFEMRSSVSMPASPITPEGNSNSRRSPDVGDDGGPSLLPPQRTTSGVYPASSSMMIAGSPRKVVATFRQVLAESPIFSGPVSKATKEIEDINKELQKQQQEWACLLCTTRNSIITSPDVCAVCGWKRHEENTKSHMSSLTKASLELAKKWKQEDSNNNIDDGSSVEDPKRMNRRNPRRNSFSSALSIGSASTQKASNKTHEPFYRKSKSTLGDLAMYLLTSSSSRQLKTPHMSSDDDDVPSRPKRTTSPQSSNPPSPIALSPSSSTLIGQMSETSRPPRPPQRPSPSSQASPSSRPPRPLRLGQQEQPPLTPDFSNRPVPDDASDSSFELPKRPSPLEPTASPDASLITPKRSNSSRLSSALMRNILPIPFDFKTPSEAESVAATDGDDGACDEENAFSDTSDNLHTEPHQVVEEVNQRIPHNEDGAQGEEAVWEESHPPKPNSDEMLPNNQSSFDTEVTDDEPMTDITLHIDTMADVSHSEDAVSISIFSDEQSSHITPTAPKRRLLCKCWSYPLRLCIIAAVLIGLILAALSSVIDWDHFGSHIREAFGGTASSPKNNSTKEPTALPRIFNNAPSLQPSLAQTTTQSPQPTDSPLIFSGSTGFEYKWVRKGNDIIVGESNSDSVNQVKLARNGTYLAVGSPSANSSAGPFAIKVYRFQIGSWDQHGGEIDSQFASHGAKAFALAESDGLTIAVASSGSVRIYTSSDITTEWIQLGSTILLENGGNDPVEMSVAVSSDGRTIAVGMVELAVSSNNNSIAKYWGTVAVYSYDGMSGNWIQVGSEIVLNRLEEADAHVSQAGVEVQLSANGQILAVRDWLKGDGHLENKSNIQVYESNNSSFWTSKGSYILSDQADGDFAFSGDGNVVAVTNSLESRVYRFDLQQFTWISSEGVLPGGRSIAMTQHASAIAIGTYAWGNSPGLVEFFQPFVGNSWTRLAAGLVGSTPTQGFGNSISVSQSQSTTLAVGLRGSVLVYRLQGKF